MSKLHGKKMIREGEYMAEVEVEVLYEEGGWSPYLSVEDARKLDEIRSALRRGDIKAAASMQARVFTLTPVQ